MTEPMKTSELREKYPKALQKFANYVSILLSEGEVEAPDDLVDVFLVNNPRMLYDFFDKELILIGVFPIDISGGNWDWEVNGILKTGHANSRPEAELDAFIAAFELLNNKLS